VPSGSAGSGSERADAVLVGRHASLRAIASSDIDWLREAETASPHSLRWRLAGEMIAPDRYPSSLFDGVLATFVFEGSKAGCRGLVSAYSADTRNGFAYVAVSRLESGSSALANALVAADGFRLFVDYLFQGWPFRKLYLECAQFNIGQFGKMLGSLRSEGCLVDHVFLDGRYWDLMIYSILRDEWPSIRNLGLHG